MKPHITFSAAQRRKDRRAARNDQARLLTHRLRMGRYAARRESRALARVTQDAPAGPQDDPGGLNSADLAPVQG